MLQKVQLNTLQLKKTKIPQACSFATAALADSLVAKRLGLSLMVMDSMPSAAAIT